MRKFRHNKHQRTSSEKHEEYLLELLKSVFGWEKRLNSQMERNDSEQTGFSVYRVVFCFFALGPSTLLCILLKNALELLNFVF